MKTSSISAAVLSVGLGAALSAAPVRAEPGAAYESLVAAAGNADPAPVSAPTGSPAPAAQKRDSVQFTYAALDANFSPLRAPNAAELIGTWKLQTVAASDGTQEFSADGLLLDPIYACGQRARQIVFQEKFSSDPELPKPTFKFTASNLESENKCETMELPVKNPDAPLTTAGSRGTWLAGVSGATDMRITEGGSLIWRVELHERTLGIHHGDSVTYYGFARAQ